MNFAEALADRLDPAPDPFVNDPVAWAEKHDVALWSAQRQILEAVRDHRKVAVHAGHGISKSFTAGLVVAWWIETRHKLGTVRAITTAPGNTQVRGILWQEINRLHKTAHLPGRTNQTEWWIDTELVGLGRKPADYDPAAFQGFHAEYLLAVLDEMGGVPQEILIAVESLASGEHSRLLAIGNPDHQGSLFHRMCTPGSGWHVIHLDVLESPNFTGEHVPPHVAAALTHPYWVQEQSDTYGEDSPVYAAKVRGLFPADQDDGVVRWSMLTRCQTAREWEPDDLLPVELGVDVGAGGDFSVIRERRGAKVGREWTDRQPDTMRVVGLVRQAIEETGATAVKVDKTGIGQGVFDRLQELRAEGEIDAWISGVMVGERSRNPKRFVNLRAQLWWEIGRELSESQGWDFSEADKPELVMGQLVAPQYHHDSSGRIVIERKEETKKRLGRSPDDADALLLAFYEIAQGGGISADAGAAAGRIRR